MLELRPDCERCGVSLPPESPDARICTFECTFCADCVDGPLGGACPNCGGNFVPRPIRPADLLDSSPPKHLTMQVDKNIIYNHLDGYRPLELDLYRPGTQFERPLPLMVYVHGGGWRVSARHSGPRETRAWDRSIFQRLTDVGFAVAAIEYRYSGEVTHPGPPNDVKDAVRWLRANAEHYGLDADRVVVWGQSAGGHVAATVALDPSVGPFRSVIVWYPLTDFVVLGDGDTESFAAMYLGHPIADDLDHARAASVTSLVHPDAPSFLLQHGTADAMAPYEQSVVFRDALAAAGVPVELDTIEGADHFFVGSDDVEGIFDRMVRFALASLDNELTG
jgi:acetyl esterase/lipase